MKGARIDPGTRFGARTLIADGKEIPDRVLGLGSPGRVLRELTRDERERLLGIARGYVERSRRHQRELRARAHPPSAS